MGWCAIGLEHLVVPGFGLRCFGLGLWVGLAGFGWFLFAVGVVCLACCGFWVCAMQNSAGCDGVGSLGWGEFSGGGDCAGC